MIRQTGGRAVGATSTRSSPASRAIRKASAVETMPTCSSLSFIKRIGEILICSLWRKFVEIAWFSYVETIKNRGLRNLAATSCLPQTSLMNQDRTPARSKRDVAPDGRGAHYRHSKHGYHA